MYRRRIADINAALKALGCGVNVDQFGQAFTLEKRRRQFEKALSLGTKNPVVILKDRAVFVDRGDASKVYRAWREREPNITITSRCSVKLTEALRNALTDRTPKPIIEF